jgi:hypothetical protein
MLENQGVGIVKFIQGNADLKITLGESHILIEFESVVEISNLAQIVQEMVDAGFVVLHKWIKGRHVLFLRIGWLVGKILKHFGNLPSE